MKHKPVFSKSLFPFLVSCMIFLTTALSAQQKYTIRTSVMSFTSNAELELITASTSEVQGLIDPTSNQFAFSVNVTSFRGFNSALQREHFNEKYMESEKFPKATFTGKIIEPLDFSADGTYDLRAKGELDIHGQKQTRIIKTKVTIERGNIQLETHFFVPLSDHNISIPAIVSQKIATEIEVEFKASMSLQSL
jgi:polyisoprenoid-binding protein YceI